MRDNAPSRLKDREPIYLDYNATTPIDATVVEAMEPFLREHYGNPSSAHAYGHAARDAVENARRQVAALVRASSAEIVFTSGGSEANNLAVKGVAFAGLARSAPDALHVIISSIEHPATTQPAAFLRRLGCHVTVLPVDRYGVVMASGTSLLRIYRYDNFR